MDIIIHDTQTYEMAYESSGTHQDLYRGCPIIESDSCPTVEN